MKKHTDDAPSGPPPSVSLPGVSMLRRRFILSSVFCLRSSTVLRMRCARASSALEPAFTERCCLEDMVTSRVLFKQSVIALDNRQNS